MSTSRRALLGLALGLPFALRAGAAYSWKATEDPHWRNPDELTFKGVPVLYWERMDLEGRHERWERFKAIKAEKERNAHDRLLAQARGFPDVQFERMFAHLEFDPPFHSDDGPVRLVL